MAILTTGNTYVDNDQVTAATLNAAINSATFAAGATDGATTQLSGGQIIVRDGGISPAKLSTGGPIWTSDGTVSATVFSGLLTGNVVGNVLGNVVGNVSGTAANVTGTVAIANGGTGATDAAGAAANLGATTVGSNLLTLPNPSAIRFLRLNADNTVSPLSDADFRVAIGAGSGGGSVTSVGISGADGIGVASSPITTSGTISLTLGSITPDDITSTNFIQGSEYRVSGTKVLGAQQAAESTISLTQGLFGGETIDEFELTNAIVALQTKVNSIIIKLRTHGIIAT